MKSQNQKTIRDNLAFIYGRNKEEARHDPDKRTFVRSVDKQVFDPDSISDFDLPEFEFLKPSFPTSVHLQYYNYFSVDERPSRTIEECTEAYPSFEHALIASKLVDVEKRTSLKAIASAQDMKKMASKEKRVNENWKELCRTIAENLLRDKFVRNKALSKRLLATGRRTLVFTNDYGDLFWGVDKQRSGQNHLGILLEKIRNEILKGQDVDQWILSSYRLLAVEKCRLKVLVEKAGVTIEDGKEFDMKNKLFVGKSEGDCDVVAAHPSVSRVHAAVVIDRAWGALLLDLDSANGTLVDGHHLKAFEPMRLSDHSSVRFGASARVYFFETDVAADERRKAELFQKVAQSATLADSGARVANSDNTVFVAKLSDKATDEDVRSFFLPCGPISHLSIPRDKASGANKGIAFVTFASYSGVVQALSRDGDELLGQYIKVKRSEARKPGAPSSSSFSSSLSHQSQKHRQPETSSNKSYYADNSSSFRASSASAPSYSSAPPSRTEMSHAPRPTNKPPAQEEPDEYSFEYYQKLYGLDQAEGLSEGGRGGGGSLERGSVGRVQTEEDSSPPRRKGKDEGRGGKRTLEEKESRYRSSSSRRSPSSGSPGREARSYRRLSPQRAAARGPEIDSSPPRKSRRSAEDSSPPRRSRRAADEDN